MPKSEIDIILTSTRGIFRDSSLPQYQTFYSWMYPHLLRVGVNARIKTVYSWQRWPETLKIGNTWHFVYDQYFGQCVARLNRNYFNLRSTDESDSFFYRVLSQQLFQRGLASEALMAALVSKQLKQTTALRIDETQRIRAVVTGLQEAFVFSHEMYHFIITMDLSLRSNVERIVLDIVKDVNVLTSDATLLNRTPAEVQHARDHLKRVQGKINSLIKTRAFLDELICDYLSIGFVILHMSQMAKSIGTLAQAIDLLFYYIRMFRTCELVANRVNAAKSFDGLTISSDELQLRHHILRKSILQTFRDSQFRRIRPSFDLELSSQDIAMTFDRNTQELFSLMYDRWFIIGNGILGKDNWLNSLSLDDGQKDALSKFAAEDVTTQYEILDNIIHARVK